MPHAVVKHLDVCHILTLSLHQHIFLVKHDRFRNGKFCVWHKIMLVQHNVPCCATITVPAVCIHNACSWSPHYMHWERISVLLCSRFTTFVSCMLLLLRTLCSPVTKLSAFVARKFLFCAVSSSFHGFTGIHFHRIWFLLVIFMWANAVASADASLSAHNSIAQSFSMSKFTVSVLVGMISQTSLKLMYSEPSVDQILPVSICSDSVWSLCLANSSFRLTNSFCGLATCVLMSSVQSHCAWKNDSISILSRCVLLRSNHAHSLSQMSFALGYVNTISATDLLSVQAIMLAAFASSCCYSVSFFCCWGCASAGRTRHFRDPSVMPSGNGHAEALKSAISI